MNNPNELNPPESGDKPENEYPQPGTGYPRPSSAQPASGYPYSSPGQPPAPNNYPYGSPGNGANNYPYGNGQPPAYPHGNNQPPNPSSYQPIQLPENAAPAQNQAQLSPLPLPLHRVLATYAILAMIIAMFVVTVVVDGASQGLSLVGQFSGATLVKLGALYTPLIQDGEWWRLITVMFLHANLIHIFLNGLNLYVLGKQLEALLGPARYIAIFFVSGIGGSIVSFGLHDRPVLGVGASGAIFGLLGAMIGYFLRQRNQFGALGRHYLRSLLSTVALNFVILLLIPGVDNFAHFGGLATGFVLGFLVSPIYNFSQTQEGQLKITQRDSGSLSWLAYVVPVLVVLFGLFMFFLNAKA